MVKRGNTTATQVLFHWAHTPPSEAAWEFTNVIAIRFLEFNLEDKDSTPGGGILI